MHRHGITADPGRQTAMINLTAELPPAVAADLLGISLSSALRWSTLTVPDQGTDITARTTVQSAPSTRPPRLTSPSTSQASSP